MVGTSFSGETKFLLKILSRRPNRDIYIITKSPPEKYSDSNSRIKGIGEEIKPLKEYENGVIVFDDLLDMLNTK